MCSKSRAFTFTINNYTEEDEDFVGSLYWVFQCRYLIVGKETCPTTGTPHLQGYVAFKNPRSWDAVADMHEHWHIEAAKGTAQQNYIYCTKSGDFMELGEKPMTPADGAKMTNQERWGLAKEGRFEELDPEHIKIYEYIYAKYQTVEDIPVLDNQWIYGPSGCGKSSIVRLENSAFYTKGMNKWWDGYQGEEVVVLDDFDPTHGSFLSYFLKIWSDHYVFRAEVKGGSMQIRPKKFIITSQYTIEQCFRLKDGEPDQPTIDAITRRFKKRHYSGFFGCFTDPDYVGNPIAPNVPDLPTVFAPGFVPPPPVAKQSEDISDDEFAKLLNDL